MSIELFKWTEGRQASLNYRKFTLAYFKLGRIGFDCYILDYYESGVLPIHTDQIKNGKHYRLNIKLFGNAEFWSEKVVFSNRFISLFRPDLYKHNLIIKSKTKKLSFGFVIFNK